jgi:ABC-type transporter Mla subunit MlaD
MKNNILTIIVSILLLASCNSESKQYVLITDNSNGVKKGNPVILKEQEVGKVVNVTLGTNLKVYSTIELEQDLNLPKDSKFVFTGIDLFTKGIEIKPGKSDIYLKYGDTIFGELTKGIPLDSVITTITDVVDNSKPVKNQDSLIKELQKLNEEIERLNEK